MKAILAIFRGDAPLAGGVAGNPDTTVADPGTTAPVDATATTVVGPEENVKGDIVPNEDIVC